MGWGVSMYLCGQRGGDEGREEKDYDSFCVSNSNE